ncbi:copine-5 isoform X3 [Panthera pardus]|uniref:Copine 5 n=7 Tax=Felidae TaxID=9681 RepID=A0ABI7Z1I8_FELCA|nr:copine-5 isoform X2 [Felis catus]XP_026913670.1 copine-5 isoform X3 [Acinonyx jubatus]XP_030171243.1 copine-5 isoform X2 [Lynx canadensis]XP_042794523.1 copine-5 isoform X2 [Panthera leo]XP_042842159.1 copine-5 isoform X2 [Panthera tigris]XP_043447190.1 copine-5 isoform X2 [Prionailurus bengalensis]XP_045353962.1 copine-5 isoform X2 [Leopardus geoffroyi]XP_046958618.1 copine-5 isoform X2 [Lynx rufus]XP_047715024.1 copine-5 isoform X2 [Prionailurus viverrinus]XP_049509325.1 copine-5 isof
MEQPEDMASLSEFDSLAGSIPATKVEITVSCRNLLDKDMFSKSDPLCVMYTQGMENKQWREFGRTEVIDNTLNPDFVRKFIVDYFFEEKQNLRFDLYDVDSKSPDLSKHDFLGQAFCTLGEIVGSPGSRLEKPLTIGAFSLNSRTGKPMPAVSNGGVPGKKCGTIILSAEELSNCRDVATMQFCANKLDKKDFFGKSDPFLVFYRSNEDGTFTICHKTEVMKNTLNPVWQTFSIPVRALCNGDYDRTIKVEVYDWDRDGSHDFIGEFTTSYRELARGQSQFNIYEVVNPKKKMKKKKYVNSGTVTLLSFAVESECTFLDYIKGGTQINFTVAIDFTASNGNPSQSTSLHYMSPYQLNAYALALTAVGEIIQHYDSDKMFPALGFGAKLPPDGRVSHEFPLNGNQENPSCCGIDGILEAYHHSLRTVQLYGPTNFAPVVTHVARTAAAVQDGSQYSVLLIITDGVISDMAQTKEAIVNAAKLPMSIIIIGVGQAEFDAMVELDGDDVRISSRGKLAERDIVQFVPFRDYVDRTGNHVLSMARLARDVLAEIPDQLVSYMKSQGIRPRPPPAAPEPSPPQSPARTPPASPLHTHI